MVSSISNSLGFGSGLDINQLVADLSAASREPKVARVNTLAKQNQARISALGQARSNLEGFANSLGQMVSDGTLRSTPTVSDPSVLEATARAGLQADSFSATIEVSQLARAQTAYSGNIASRTSPIGQGTMTLTIGGVDRTITIGSVNDNLDGLVAAINDSGAGVTASIIGDGGGFRMVLKGTSGEANAFTLTADEGSDPGLAAVSYGPGGTMTLGQSAADAQFKIDGVAFSRASNIVDNIVPGLSITLKKAAPGQPVNIGASRPIETIKQTVTDFVAVYNQMKASLSSAANLSGSTNSLRDLERELASMVSKVLTSHGSINKLTDIGISTTREGTLTLNSTKLEAMLATDAGAVEALFNPRRDATHNETTDPGIAYALDAIRDKAVATDGVIGRVAQSLDFKKNSLLEQLEKINTREDAYEARLQKQYGGLDARLAAFKATQNYLEQQIAMWNNQKN